MNRSRQIKGRRSVCCHLHTETVSGQVQLEQIANGRFILNDEDQTLAGPSAQCFAAPARLPIRARTPPTATIPTPTQNMGQFPRTMARVPMANAMVMMTTTVHANGEDPWLFATLIRVVNHARESGSVGSSPRSS